MKTLGFDNPVYILPFDHRGSFETKMFGWHGDLNAAQTAEIAAAKQVIYDGFKAAIAGGVPKAKAGILVDEEFRSAILRDARANGYTIACPAEKSGQDEFDFEYGADFPQHIEEFQPTFCKVLVRYNRVLPLAERISGSRSSTTGQRRSHAKQRWSRLRDAIGNLRIFLKVRIKRNEWRTLL